MIEKKKDKYKENLHQELKPEKEIQDKCTIILNLTTIETYLKRKVKTAGRNQDLKA